MMATFYKEELFIMTTVMQRDHRVTEIVEEAKVGLNVDVTDYEKKSFRMISEETTDEQVIDILVKNALENIDEVNPDWTYMASRIYLRGLYNEAAKNRGYDPALK